MFDGPNAPLATFSARIDFSHRIGVISHHLARDLHLIRRIRNLFAHSVEGCTFKSGSSQDQVNELVRSMNLPGRDPGIDQPPYNNTKGRFVISVIHIVAFFIHLLDKGPGPIEPPKQESIYTAEVDIKPERVT